MPFLICRMEITKSFLSSMNFRICAKEIKVFPLFCKIYGNTTLNSISQKSLMEDTSKTSVYLKNLIELGIVQREFSVDAKVKEWANGNRGIYRLTDNFFRFWYAFVFANFSQLEDGDVDGVYEYIVEPALHEFAARNSYRLRPVNFCKISCRCYRNYCGEIGVMVTLK